MHLEEVVVPTMVVMGLLSQVEECCVIPFRPEAESYEIIITSIFLIYLQFVFVLFYLRLTFVYIWIFFFDL